MTEPVKAAAALRADVLVYYRRYLLGSTDHNNVAKLAANFEGYGDEGYDERWPTIESIIR